MSSALRRAWLLTNIVVTIALLPALFPDRDGGGETTVAAAATVATDLLGAVHGPPSTMLVAIPTTASTTVPPTTSAPATKQSAPAPATTTTAPPPRAPTPTTAAPPPTTTTTIDVHPPEGPEENPPAPTGSERGRATWYDWKPGICAHKTLPFGTVVTVNAVNGRSVQCTVGDRGPFVEGYIIDLHWQEFEQLTSRDAGRIDVTITW